MHSEAGLGAQVSLIFSTCKMGIMMTLIIAAYPVYFGYILPFLFLQEACEVGSIVASILQMRKLRFRKMPNS